MVVLLVLWEGEIRGFRCARLVGRCVLLLLIVLPPNCFMPTLDANAISVLIASSSRNPILSSFCSLESSLLAVYISRRCRPPTNNPTTRPTCRPKYFDASGKSLRPMKDIPTPTRMKSSPHETLSRTMRKIKNTK
jgi:hypothetical protein